MQETAKLKKLKIFLNIFGVVSLLLFGTLLLLTAIDSPMMQEGGALRAMRWDVLSKNVELMLEAIYFVWGIFMLLAARNPLAYLSFLDFTLWANLVHGLVMVPQAMMLHGFMYKMYSDVAYCIVLAAGLWLLRPKGEEIHGR
jgi:hypothetical protein